MTDSTKAGFLDQEATNVQSADFDDQFQAWLANALGIDSRMVYADIRFNVSKVSDCCDFAIFRFGEFQETGTVKRQSLDCSEVRHYGSVECTVVIYSDQARQIAQLLCDAGDFDQNVYDLQKLGLSWIEGKVKAFLSESVGARLKLRADVTLSFNYMYSRKWAVKKIVSATPQLIFNE